MADALPCPFCDSADTERASTFGTSLMVAMHYCRHCKSHFEAIKWGEAGTLDVPEFLQRSGPTPNPAPDHTT